MKRISIDACDVAILIGRDISTAQKLLRTIKDVLSKEKHQRVTIKEFCDYEGFPFEEIFNMINKNRADAEVALLSNNDENSVVSKGDRKSA